MKNCVIGFCGVTLNSVNYGVSALGYSHIKIVDECLKKEGVHVQYIFFTMENHIEQKCVKNELQLAEAEIICTNSASLRAGLRGMRNLSQSFRGCDIVFDLTQGDSFTDIYGSNRFILSSIEKFLAIKNCGYLILSPQTIGPFNNKVYKILAGWLMNKALAVYARDDISYNEAIKIAPKSNLYLSSDLAFELPYVCKKTKGKDSKIKIGINVSGLLWRGGYSGKNEFGLTMDYKKYICKLIKKLLDSKQYEVHMIAHVYSEFDSDYDAICELGQKYTGAVIAPIFGNPIEAKSYISDMDIFLGSRMHSTIAALSSYVVTIPISYSRKFEGLFESIGYDYVIHACKWNTDESLENTWNYIRGYKDIKAYVIKANQTAREKNKVFKKDVRIIMEQLVLNKNANC